jgi:small subunit ribosomal protein S1
VSGRVMQVSGDSAQVELGEGIQATCRIPISGATQAASPGAPSAGQKTDLASMTSRLQARWKSGATAEASKPQELKAGQVRSFRITKIEAPTKKVEIDLA